MGAAPEPPTRGPFTGTFTVVPLQPLAVFAALLASKLDVCAKRLIARAHRAFVGLLAWVHPHVYEQLVPGVERAHAPGTASPLARVLRAGAPRRGVHVQFLDVPHQRFLTCAIHGHRAPFPLAGPHAIAGVACKTGAKKKNNKINKRPWNRTVLLCGAIYRAFAETDTVCAFRHDFRFAFSHVYK